MHFGEAVDEERLSALLRPADGISTVLTADAYGAGDADALLGRALAGVRARGLLPRRRDRARLLHRRARGREGLPALHRPAAARPGRLRRLCPNGDRAQPRALRRGRVRPPAPAQPRPYRLHERACVGCARGRARRRAGGSARRRAGARERVHARPDRLPGALRRADRLGDGDPQPARAVARRAGAGRGAAPRRAADHAGRRLRRPVPRRRAARPRLPALGPPLVPAGRLGRARPRADGADAAGRRAPRPDDAPARVRVEPGARSGRVRGADADPGGRARTRGRSRTSAPSWPPCPPGPCSPPPRWPRSARSATTPAA